jgi:hypothetical protein
MAGSRGIEPRKRASKTRGLPLTELPAIGWTGGNRTLDNWFTASQSATDLRPTQEVVCTNEPKPATPPALLVDKAALESASAGLQPAATPSQLLVRKWWRIPESNRSAFPHCECGAHSLQAYPPNGCGSENRTLLTAYETAVMLPAQLTRIEIGPAPWNRTT